MHLSRTMHSRIKLQNWCGFQAENSWKGAPVLEFGCSELLETIKIRYSSEGWNPVGQIFQKLGSGCVPACAGTTSFFGDSCRNWRIPHG